MSTASATNAPAQVPLADPFAADATQVAERLEHEPQDLRDPFVRDADRVPASQRPKVISNAASAGLRDPFRAKRRTTQTPPEPKDLRSPFDGPRSRNLAPRPAPKHSSDVNLRDPFAS